MTAVVFETLFKSVFDGWSIASRAYARAMVAGGLDVRLVDWKDRGDVADEVRDELPRRALEPPTDWDAHLFSCPLGSPEAHRAARTFELFHRLNRPPRLFYTMFERRRVQHAIVEELNRLEGCFVPCSSNYAALRAAGCETVTWFPYPYFDDDPHLSLPPPRREPKTLLWVGRWEPRKAPHNLVRAFLTAFKPGEMSLVLKLGPTPWVRGAYPEPENVIADSLLVDSVGGGAWTLSSANDAIQVVRGKLSAAEMLALHARSDIYVSASRGEGIELGAFHAKLAGRRVVTTDSGGPMDFLGEDDAVVPAPDSVGAPEYEWIWGEGAEYADYDVDDLAAAMQAVAMPCKIRPERVPSAHRGAAVGTAVRTWVESVCK